MEGILEFIKSLAGGARDFFRGGKREEEEMISPLPKEPMATPTPTATPTPDSPLFDFAPYRQSGNFEIQQPPDQLGAAARQIFGDKAEKAAIVMGTENPNFDPNAVNQNKDGSIDVGVFQVNSRTLEDFLRRKPKKLAEIGVDAVEDLYDPMKNMKVAKLILDEQGWGAWYGPGNKGYNLQEEGDNE